MNSEKLNSGNWKEGIEEVNNLPGYILQNKQQAWEDLHNRLHTKPRRIGFTWYWAAAACLIIISSIIFITTGKKNNAVVINTPIKSQHEKIILKQPSNKENIEIKNSTLNIIKEKSFARSNKKSSTNIFRKKEIVNDSIVQTVAINHETQIVLPEIKDSIKQTIAAIIPAQKKMKVVHVNELDDSNNVNIVQGSGHLPLRIKFFNQDIYTDYTIRSANTGFKILKLNPFPSN